MQQKKGGAGKRAFHRVIIGKAMKEGEERPHVTTPFSSESVYQNKDCPSD